MSHEWSPARVDRGNWAILLSVATLGFVLHLVTAGYYGIFRDELYYLDCARHLDWGFVDQPPLSIALLKTFVAVFGDSVWSIRLLPALAGVTLVIFTGLMALRFGGSRFSVMIASLAALVVPVYLINTGFYSMNAFDLILWAGLFLVLAQILATQNSRLWLFFGSLSGLA
ncbi:MAG: glycosyltransferase family 39 protein, partial [candidate division Zixibacteria bacterium]|nr:glycosyltransferase family 39 protein [candidate division Zixibacteria bacterium]